MEVEVVRSTRRRKTVSAREVGGVLRLSIPATMSVAEERRWSAEMVRRFERRRRAGALDLEDRAVALATAHGLPRPASIRWVSNQRARWASCTTSTGDIRVSDRLAGFPPWVLDAVVVHELAHLVEPGHGPAFRALVDRYPLTERATGFLIAKGLEGDPDHGRGCGPPGGEERSGS